MSEDAKTRQTLLMRAKNPDDHQAWEEFIEVYKRFIYHILHRMNIHENDFDDLVQEILLRLWKKLGSYNPEEGRFRSWLARVIRNLVLDYLDSADRRNRKHDLMEKEAYLYTASQSEQEKMIKKEWKLYLSKIALENMRKVFSGHAVDVLALSIKGVSNDDISKQLNIKPASVRVLKSRVNSRFLEEVKRLIRELESQ